MSGKEIKRTIGTIKGRHRDYTCMVALEVERLMPARTPQNVVKHPWDHAIKAVEPWGNRGAPRSQAGQRVLDAVEKGDAHELGLLLADASRLARPEEVQLALILAAQRDQEECIMALARDEGDPMRADACGWTPLMIAAAWGSASSCQALLPLSDPLAVDKWGRSALTLAAHGGQEETIRLLCGAGLRAQSWGDRTLEQLALSGPGRDLPEPQRSALLATARMAMDIQALDDALSGPAAPRAPTPRL